MKEMGTNVSVQLLGCICPETDQQMMSFTAEICTVSLKVLRNTNLVSRPAEA